MPTIETLIVTQPPLTAGVQTPYRGVHPNPELFGPWRFSVEIAAVDPTTAQWSVAEWGDETVNPGDNWEDDDVGYDWVDITDDVRGIEWTRGADEPYGRTRTGTATIQLDNRTNRYSPWALDPSSPFVASQQVLGPGTVIRWGYRRSFPTDETFQALTWRPLFCGIVEFWDTETEGGDADQWAEIPIVETTAALAAVDEPARTPVGAGEFGTARINRLLAPAETGWPFGTVVMAVGVDFGGYQATTMAGNRLTEILLTVDSNQYVESSEFRSDRQGRPTWGYVGTVQLLRWDERNAMGNGDAQTKLAVFAADDALAADELAVIPPGRTPIVGTYHRDALKRRATHDNVINWVSLANAGESAFVAEDTTSRVLYGRRTFQRHDLVQTSNPPHSGLANRILIERANPHPEVQPFTVYADTSPGTWDVLTVTDAQENCVLFGHSPTVALLCRVRTIVHRILPDPSGLLHEADFTLDVIDELEEI